MTFARLQRVERLAKPVFPLSTGATRIVSKTNARSPMMSELRKVNHWPISISLLALIFFKKRSICWSSRGSNSLIADTLFACAQMLRLQRCVAWSLVDCTLRVSPEEAGPSYQGPLIYLLDDAYINLMASTSLMSSSLGAIRRMSPYSW